MADGDEELVLLDGTVDRIVWQDETSHFTVARFAGDRGDPATVVGVLYGIKEGQPLRLRGRWQDDKKWGRQFRVETFQTRSPETLVGIERFLGSGLIPGIGPEIARRLVERFGLDTLKVIEETPSRLTQVEGIGAQRAAKLAAAFVEQKRLQDVMVFLRGHGVSSGFAVRIVRQYGDAAMKVVRENPYRLAREVWGIGFRTADGIAQSLGIARDAPARLEAGILFALQSALEDGHLHVTEDDLGRDTAELLGVERAVLAAPLVALERTTQVVRESLGYRGVCFSLVEAWQAETSAATALAALVRAPARGVTLDVDAALHDFEVARSLELAPGQRRAVAAALVDKCVVITGGPGVGKTTIVRGIVHLARLLRRKVALAAPTGRAALRLAEATGAEALTLHRLLEYSPHTSGFGRDKSNPLDAELVIVDESSMVDVPLFAALLAAIPPAAQLVLVGDVDQLPSVGPGAVLGDVIASDAATVVRLTEIFRQAAQSQIVVNAHRINQGEMPELDGGGGDFFFIARDEPDAARSTVIELCAERIPSKFGLDPIRDVQVLAPMHRGDLGTQALNAALQERLNPPRPGGAELQRGDRAIRLGDKVMQLKNDYEKGVYNGDLGVVTRLDGEKGELEVELADGRRALYQRAELDQLVLAYATSVHKSQGSEYPAVVIPLATQHYMMLERSLLYTAVTRGKRLVVIVGSRKALSMAVRNTRQRRRNTWLAERIREQVSG